MRTLAILLLLAPLAAFADSRIVRFSMGGDIEVNDAPSGATLRTMGGDIRVSNSNGVVVAKTMGGNIRVRRLAGSLDAATMGGNVRVEILGDGSGRSIELSSMGGQLEIEVPKDFAADFDVQLEQNEDERPGHIHTDIPLHITESHRRHWFRRVTVLTATGKVGNGGNRIRLWTIGGDITIHAK